MTVHHYHDLINEGIKELPESALAEIADFVYFVRLRTLSASSPNSNLYTLLLDLDLQQARKDSLHHLEEEFADYDQHYPKE
ncbi:MAG: hypothetical protein KF893_26520 [Caldilineaceae bacterium]|nr:hypothetical protein [Caldilineaceae bacterium]